MTPQTAQVLQTYAALVLTAATVLTLGVLMWYTIETYRLRKAAQVQTTQTASLVKEAGAQTERTASLVREAQRQNELVEATFRQLEQTEIRRQKVECIVALFGLRFVLGNNPAFPEFRAQFMYALNKIAVLWADDANVLKNLRDFYGSVQQANQSVGTGHDANQRLVILIRSLGTTTKLPLESIGDKDITDIFML